MLLLVCFVHVLQDAVQNVSQLFSFPLPIPYLLHRHLFLVLKNSITFGYVLCEVHHHIFQLGRIMAAQSRAEAKPDSAASNSEYSICLLLSPRPDSVSNICSDDISFASCRNTRYLVMHCVQFTINLCLLFQQYKLHQWFYTWLFKADTKGMKEGPHTTKYQERKWWSPLAMEVFQHRLNHLQALCSHYVLSFPGYLLKEKQEWSVLAK